MIAIHILESDFATTEKQEKDGNPTTIDKRASRVSLQQYGE
jgi:hypothetical protein